MKERCLTYGTDYHTLNSEEFNKLNFCPDVGKEYTLIELVLPASQQLRKPLKFNFLSGHVSTDSLEAVAYPTFVHLRFPDLEYKNPHFPNSNKRSNSYWFNESSDSLVRFIAIRNSQGEYYSNAECCGVRIKRKEVKDAFRDKFSEMWREAIDFSEYDKRMRRRLRKQVQDKSTEPYSWIDTFLSDGLVNEVEVEEKIRDITQSNRHPVYLKAILSKHEIAKIDREMGISEILRLWNL
jgi:hypothetical protein